MTYDPGSYAAAFTAPLDPAVTTEPYVQWPGQPRPRPTTCPNPDCAAVAQHWRDIADATADREAQLRRAYGDLEAEGAADRRALERLRRLCDRYGLDWRAAS